MEPKDEFIHPYPKDLETGEKGHGVEEYLLNPNEPYHENPGVSID